MILLNFILFSLAAMCNAVMYTCTHHYSTSVFKNLNPKFWNAEISWRSKYIDNDPKMGRKKWFWGINYPVQISDSFHFFKSLMIIFICLTISTFDRDSAFVEYNILSLFVIILIYGIIWNLTFSLFYNKVLRK